MLFVFLLLHIVCTQANAQQDTSALRKKLQETWETPGLAPDTMLKRLHELEQQCIAAGYRTGAAKAFMYEARTYDQSGNFEQCRQYCHKGMPFCDSSAAGQFILNRLYNQTANSYVEQGSYQQATSFYYKALQQALFHNNSLALVGTYNNIGLLMNEVNQYESALYYLQKAAHVAETIGAYDQVGTSLVNEAIAYSSLKQDDKALDCYYKALDIAVKYKQDNQYISALTGISLTYTELKQADSGLVYGLKALAVEKPADIYNSIFIHYAIGNAYSMLHRNKEAVPHLEKFLELSRNINLGRYTAEAQKALGKVYYEEGQPAKAAAYLSDYITAADTLNNSETEQKIMQMQIRYRTLEQENALAKSQLQVALQESQIKEKNFLIVVAGLIAALVLLCIMLRYRHIIKNREEALRLQKHDQAISELQAAIDSEEKERRRIARELHDEIGGALAIAKIRYGLLERELPSLVADNNYKQIGLLLDKVKAGVRSTSHSLLPDTILRNTLPEALRLMTEPVQFSGGPSITVQCFGTFAEFDADAELKLDVYRIVQELVNNIVKHAQASAALIELMHVNDVLKITVEDNGIGYDTAAVAPGGQGLENVKVRVRHLKGNISTESVAGLGTTVYIEVDVAHIAKRIVA